MTAAERLAEAEDRLEELETDRDRLAALRLIRGGADQGTGAL